MQCLKPYKVSETERSEDRRFREKTVTKNERLHHITTVLRARRRITRAQLQEETGASRATLMRDLAWLRNELNHPIHWGSDAQCYQWRGADHARDAPEELAGLWFKPSEVLALLTLEQLLREIQPDDLMRRHLQHLNLRLKKILQQSGLDRGIEQQLGERIRVIGIGQRPVSPMSFETVGLAISQRRRLAMHYHARGNGEHSERTVSPQRLVYYRRKVWRGGSASHKLRPCLITISHFPRVDPLTFFKRYCSCQKHWLS